MCPWTWGKVCGIRTRSWRLATPQKTLENDDFTDLRILGGRARSGGGVQRASGHRLTLGYRVYYRSVSTLEGGCHNGRASASDSIRGSGTSWSWWHKPRVDAAHDSAFVFPKPKHQSLMPSACSPSLRAYKLVDRALVCSACESHHRADARTRDTSIG